MNERIKELAEQAGFVLWKDESYNSGDVIDWSSSYDNELKKFAELIVAECTKILADNNEFRGCVIISKHFGVEE